MKIGDTTTGADATGKIPMVAQRAAARALRPAHAEPGHIEVADVAQAARRLLGRVDDTTPDPVRAAQVEILRKLLVELAAEPRR